MTRQRGDLAGMRNPRLVAKPVARSKSNENDDDAAHHVVLPNTPLEIPEDEALETRSHLPECISHFGRGIGVGQGPRPHGPASYARNPNGTRSPCFTCACTVPTPSIRART